MPLYVLGFMGMPRRMEHYNVPGWQPFLIVAALGAVVILLGIICLIVQLAVSVRQRHEAHDLTGDPWDGRTLEWMTASPPAPYNFAVLPQVSSIDAFQDFKRRGVAYMKPSRYVDIEMPRNTGAGVMLGGLAFLLGFAIVWHIWWMALAALFAVGAAVAARASNDETEYWLSASEVERIESPRYRILAASARTSRSTEEESSLATEPLPENPS